MDTLKSLKIAKKSFWSLVLAGMLAASASFFILLSTERNYKASSDVLVIQNAEGFVDSYTLSRSAEYMTRILSEGVYTEAFINEVGNSGLADLSFLPSDKRERSRQWRKTVRTRSNIDLGILGIDVYVNNRKNALDLSRGVLSVLTEKNSLFRGQNQNIEVRVINEPVVEKNPGAGRVAAVTLAGFALGVLGAFAVAYGRVLSGKKQIVFADTAEEELDQLRAENYAPEIVESKEVAAGPENIYNDMITPEAENKEEIDYWTGREDEFNFKGRG